MKKIKFLRFKEDLAMPGLAGAIGKTLPSQSKSIPDLLMYSTPECYIVRVLGKEIEISRDLVMYAELAETRLPKDESSATKDSVANAGAPQTVPLSTVVFNTKASS